MCVAVTVHVTATLFLCLHDSTYLLPIRRKTMIGLLAAKDIQCSHHRVGAALKTVSPDYAQSRRQGIATLLNPTPYRADYKLHVDQNEKLAMFSAPHVAGVDEFSSKVVGLVTMSVKNNVAIYEHLYRYEFVIHLKQLYFAN